MEYGLIAAGIALAILAAINAFFPKTAKGMELTPAGIVQSVNR